MTEQQAPPTPEAAPTPAALSPEVEEGKPFAILSYALNFIGLPFFLVPLILRNNEFSLYHAKQCLLLWLLGIAGAVVSGLLAIVCVGILLGLALAVALLVLNIIGLINAIQGQAKPLPIIGPWAEEWFKGLRKV